VLFDPSRPNNFDLLRFVAATLVLIDHSAVLTGRPGIAGPFGYETLGGFAVAVFFVISGFLVAASWERAPRLGAFTLKRALRIVPAYAAVVALAALALGPLVTELASGAYFRNPLTWAYFRNLTFVELHYSLPGVFHAQSFSERRQRLDLDAADRSRDVRRAGRARLRGIDDAARRIHSGRRPRRRLVRLGRRGERRAAAVLRRAARRVYAAPRVVVFHRQRVVALACPRSLSSGHRSGAARAADGGPRGVAPECSSCTPRLRISCSGERSFPSDG
jgi:hypothetical protein